MNHERDVDCPSHTATTDLGDWTTYQCVGHRRLSASSAGRVGRSRCTPTSKSAVLPGWTCQVLDGEGLHVYYAGVDPRKPDSQEVMDASVVEELLEKEEVLDFKCDLSDSSFSTDFALITSSHDTILGSFTLITPSHVHHNISHPISFGCFIGHHHTISSGDSLL